MTNYEKLKAVIDEIDVLIAKKATIETPELLAWHTKTKKVLIQCFGAQSFEVNEFCNVAFAPGFVDIYSDYEPVLIAECKVGLQMCKTVFLSYLEDLKDGENQNKSINHHKNKSKVFIVHGHDSAMKQAVARLIEKQGIEAIVLCEKANQGRTIIEKFEKYSDVGGAVCLFTADDIGNIKSATEQFPRARQNVILETGYFMGKLGRDHIVILADEKVEIPSDLAGVVYTNISNWEFELLKELKSIGYKIDLNKLV